MAVDLGFDMRLKLILSRAEQLVKQEGTVLVETKSLSYNLQRKVPTPEMCPTLLLLPSERISPLWGKAAIRVA